MHMANKNQLLLPINQEGLCIRPMELVNMSLLAKQLWQVLSSNSLPFLATLVGKKYIDWSQPQWLKRLYNSLPGYGMIFKFVVPSLWIGSYMENRQQ